MAALHLQRLGHLVGEPRYLEAATRAMTLFAGESSRAPHGFGTLVNAMAEYQTPPAVVLLTGPPAALSRWRAELASRYLPGVLTLQLPENTSGLPAALAKPVEHRGAGLGLSRHVMPAADR